MKPCPNCAGGVWVVRDTSCSSGKKNAPVFACKKQTNLPSSTRKQHSAQREVVGSVSVPVSLEDAVRSSGPSQNSASSAIPASIREDSPEIEFRPPVLCIPAAPTQGKDPTPNSESFATDVCVDQRHEPDRQGNVGPRSIQPPGAVDDSLSNSVLVLSASMNGNANGKHRERIKRRLRKSSRKSVRQMDFVEDDSDADPDWAPEKGFDFNRIDSEDDSFSHDDSASDNECPRRKRRNANGNRKLACAESSLGNSMENERTVSPHKTTNPETLTPTTHAATVKPIAENRSAVTGGVLNPCSTVETVLKTVTSGLPNSKIERVTTGPVCPEDGSDWMPDITSDEEENHAADTEGVKNPRSTIETVLPVMKSGLQQPRIERVTMSRGTYIKRGGIVQIGPVSSKDNSDWMPDITSSEDGSDDECTELKAGSTDSCRQSTHTLGLHETRKSKSAIASKNTAGTDVTSSGGVNPSPQLQTPRRRPVWQGHREESDLGLEHLEITGSFGYCCCGCYYPNKAVWELHQFIHRKDSAESAKRQCPCCSFVAESFVDLVQHTSQHALDAEADKMCFLCGWTGTDLFSHWRASHRDLKDKIKRSHKFKCRLCRNRYRIREELNDHLQEMHPSVESRQSSIEYMQKTGFLSYYCPTCARYFPSRSLLDLHNVSHAAVDVQGECPERQCPACDFVSANLGGLLTHVMTHAVTVTGKKQCLFCCDQRVSLWGHYTGLHPEFRDLISKDWQFQCEQCEQKFFTERSIKFHVRVMHGEVQCLYCALRFHSGPKLSQHVRAEHAQDNGFQCPFCPKVFAGYSQVHRHYRKIHDIGQVVICDVCQRVFRNKVRHQLHYMAKHSNEHRFVCKDCGKKYQTGMLLSQHVVRHHQWTEADRKKFNDRQKERRAEHKKKALLKDSDEADD